MQIGSTDAGTAGRVLNETLDDGVTFLDTAKCYGRSEEFIGRTIAHRRAEFVLATKVGHAVGRESRPVDADPDGGRGIFGRKGTSSWECGRSRGVRAPGLSFVHNQEQSRHYR